MIRLTISLTAALLLVPGGAWAGEAKKALFQLKGELKADDKTDAVLKKSFHKAHDVKLEAGKGYRIDLTSRDFDTFLRLENEDAKNLAMDDDGGGGLNSRIVYLVPKDQGGTYRVVVTSYKAGDTGNYELVITEAGKMDVLGAKVRRLSALPPDEQAQVVAEFRKVISESKDLGADEAGLALNLAMSLEYKGDPKVAADVFREFGKAFALATDPKVSRMAKMLQGAARRMDLVGNPIEIKGPQLNGKQLDWSAYKGKVVLIDFWATWCGPCRAELPNIKKMHEIYHKRGFEVIGISLDNNADIAAKFMEKENLPWACIFEERGEGKEDLTTYYGVFSIPQAVLVGRDGRVVSLRARGAELPRLLEKLIGPEEEKK